MLIRAALLLISCAALIALPLPHVFAQSCAMCYQGAAASGPQGAAALRHGILLLFIPAMIFVGIFALIYHRRNVAPLIATSSERLRCSTADADDSICARRADVCRTVRSLVFRLVQIGADSDRAVRIHGAVTLLHMLNFSFLVHHDRGSLRPLVFAALHVVGLQNPVRSKDFMFMSLRRGKVTADLLCECGVCCGAVDADSEYDGVACFQLGHISLIGLQFLRSTTGKRQNVEGQDDVFLSAKITELHRLPVIRQQSEVRRNVSYLQVRLGNGVFLRRSGKLTRQHQQQKKPDDRSDDRFIGYLLVGFAYYTP